MSDRALMAQPFKLQQVPLYFEPSLPRGRAFQFPNVAIREIGHGPTRSTHYVVMMSSRSSHEVASTSVVPMYSANEIKVRQYLERTVDRDKPEGWIAFTDSFVNGGWRQVVHTRSDHVQYRTPLRRDFETMPPQGDNHFLSGHRRYTIENRFHLR